MLTCEDLKSILDVLNSLCDRAREEAAYTGQDVTESGPWDAGEKWAYLANKVNEELEARKSK